MKELTVVWLRRDLRLDDQQLFSEHAVDTALLAPVYCFNPRELAPLQSCAASSPHSVARLGPFAAQLLLESLHELRTQLRSRGSELFIRFGIPSEVLPQFVRSCVQDPQSVSVVWCQEAGVEEQRDEAQVTAALEGLATCTSCWGSTLYHPECLPSSPDRWAALAHPRQKRKCKGAALQEPFSPVHGLVDVRPARFDGMPRVMGEFRRCLRAGGAIQCPLTAPDALPVAPAEVDPGFLPELEAMYSKPCSLFGLGLQVTRQAVQSAMLLQQDHRSATAGLHGGESAGMERLGDFVQGAAAEHRERGGGDVAGHTSAKLSAYLALGVLSARRVHSEACKHDGAKWLTSHLEMRDYFSFCALRDGSRMFRAYGQKAPVVLWKALDVEATEQWRRWATGTTGMPLVDAAMHQLWATGWISNRCRQNCVSFLTKDLQLDWRLGAELFQWLLADHDLGSNWGNWRYFSGVGDDPKHRHFRTISQGLMHDDGGLHLKRWLPMLAELVDSVGNLAHLAPLLASGQAGTLMQVMDLDLSDEVLREIRTKWPVPLVDPMDQLTWSDRNRLFGVERVETVGGTG